MTGPTPKTSVRDVPEARTATASFFLVSRSWASMRRRSARNSAASSGRACRTAPHGSAPSRIGGLSCVFPCEAAGDQLAQHGVQPAGDLGPGPAQVPVPLGPYLQHRRVVIGPDRPAGGRAQRRDRDRAGVVGVVLVHRSRRPAAAPGRRAWAGRPAPARRRRPAAGPAGAPGPPAPPTAQVRCGQAAAHASSRSAWAAEARTRTWPSGSSAAPIATAVCEPLCGSTPIITAATIYPFPRFVQVGPRRACLIPDRSASHLLRATPRQDPTGRHVVSKPDHRPAGSGYESQAYRTSERYDPGRNAYTESAIRRISHVGTIPSVTMRDRHSRHRAVRDAATAQVTVTADQDRTARKLDRAYEFIGQLAAAPDPGPLLDAVRAARSAGAALAAAGAPRAPTMA